MAFGASGRIVSVGASGLDVLSDDTGSELVVKFTETTEFVYNDDRLITGEEKQNYESSIGIVFTAREDSDPDMIILCRKREP
jgi:hypothetical protein